MCMLRLVVEKVGFRCWMHSARYRSLSASPTSFRYLCTLSSLQRNASCTSFIHADYHHYTHSVRKRFSHMSSESRSSTDPDTDDEKSTLPAFSPNGTVVLSNIRRLKPFAVSTLAVGQGVFWLAASYLSGISTEPLLSPLWTFGGAGLSFMFGGMVHLYLSRLVAVISVDESDGTRLGVTTYSFGGYLRTPRIVKTSHIVGGPKRDASDERYWTFGVQPDPNKRAYYYILDKKRGVLDEEAIRAICSTPRGGSLLMILAHKRQANEMRSRWRDWQRKKGVKARVGG